METVYLVVSENGSILRQCATLDRAKKLIKEIVIPQGKKYYIYEAKMLCSVELTVQHSFTWKD